MPPNRNAIWFPALCVGACLFAQAGCARMLGSVLAPQATAANAAGTAAQSVGARTPAQELGTEVNRLLAGRNIRNREDLDALQRELDRMRPDGGRAASEGREPRSREPSRYPTGVTGPSDRLVVDRPADPARLRGAIDRPQVVADGVPAGQSLRVLDLSRVRATAR